MKVWPQDCISRAEDKCCGPQAVADARGVAHALGFPHYVVDEADQFEELVINYFSSEYQAGRTPNPCVMCNEKLKFGSLWQKAEALGCDYIATGHYAIIDHANEAAGVGTPGHNKRAVLRRGIDPRKDQSYFLFSLRQEQLQRALTPLGWMAKSEIRTIARKLGLKVADKADSQEICFVPGQDYKAFLRSHLGENEFHRGGIYDLEGNFIAGHEGIEMFTIGQRKGLPGGSAQPRYVVDLDPETNRVIVGSAEDLLVEEFEVERVNWISRAGVNDLGPRDAVCVLTHDHKFDVPAILAALDTSVGYVGAMGSRRTNDERLARLREAGVDEAVFYDDDVVLGGGWICRQVRAGPALAMIPA